MENLTEKQIRFIDEYLVDGNATQAAIRAGYSEKTAHVQGPRMLSNVRVSEEIDKRRSEMAEELRKQFVLDALTARRVMLKILKDPDASNRDKIAIARDLLDRAGYKPTEKTEISGSNGNALEVIFVDPTIK